MLDDIQDLSDDLEEATMPEIAIRRHRSLKPGASIVMTSSAKIRLKSRVQRVEGTDDLRECP
jgi:hypothetical protein